jgi:superfamily I DNA and RNA helicase
MQFHQTDNLQRPGGAAEATVWNALRPVFKDRPGQAFWRFPIFSNTGGRRKEPDILILDRELGILVIEVKGYTMHNIVRIQGHAWNIQGGPNASSNPYQQAEDVGWTLHNRAGRLRTLRGHQSAPVKVVVALPNISRSEWRGRNFGGVHDPESHLLFAEDLQPPACLSRIREIPNLNNGSALTDERFEQLQVAVTGLPVQTGEPATDLPENMLGRKEALEYSAAFLQDMDIKQMKIACEIPPGFQQIRGMAGSGKTILLCHKAAAMHLKCPEWQIALVFFTRSLYEQVQAHLDRALKYQSEGEVTLQSAQNQIHVLHAWGAAARPGFYRRLAHSSGINPLGVGDVPEPLRNPPARGLAHVCQRMLAEAEGIESLYDAVLIDEAQDLIVGGSTRYKNREPFFWLAYQSLKPIEGNEDGIDRRLIWAYDEAQSLDSLLIPTAKEILSKDFAQATSGFHEGNIQRSHVMQKCYRTPGPVLAAATIIGMGLYRPQGPVTAITNQEGWTKVGWEVVNGQFMSGREITLRRPAENSPNPIPKLVENKTIQCAWQKDADAEKKWLLRSIQTLIQEGVRPERILVIIPNDHLGGNQGQSRLGAMANYLQQNGISSYKAGASVAGMFYEFPAPLPDRFCLEGSVTFSHPYRAKGNEVDVVFLVAIDLLETMEGTFNARNQIFTSMTRTKGWCYLSGVFVDELNLLAAGLRPEIERVVADALKTESPEFTFTYQPPGAVIDDGEQMELVLVESPIEVAIAVPSLDVPPGDTQEEVLFERQQQTQIYEVMRILDREELEDKSLGALARHLDIPASILAEALLVHGFTYNRNVKTEIPEQIWSRIKQLESNE